MKFKWIVKILQSPLLYFIINNSTYLNEYFYTHDVWAVWSHTFSWWELKLTKIAFTLELLELCFSWIFTLLNKHIPAPQPAPCHRPISLTSGMLSPFVLPWFLWLLHLGIKSGQCCWHCPGSTCLILHQGWSGKISATERLLPFLEL